MQQRGHTGIVFWERLVRSTYIGLTAAIAITAFSTPAAAQATLAQRVSQVPDGIAHVQFPSRSGTCGDGKDLIGYRKALFAHNFQSIGDWDAPNCHPGPMRVELYISRGRVTRVNTFVGGSWPRTSERVTDLGVVSPNEAAAYFFALVPLVERSGKDDRLLLPAVLADDPGAVTRLIALANDEARLQDTRRQAIQWMGLLGDVKVVPVLVTFARQGGAGPTGGEIDENTEAPGKKGLGTSAMAALSTLENGVGVPALIDLARNASAGMRASAVFWLGQTGDTRAHAELHRVIENGSEDERLRAHAIFSLSNGGDVPASEYAYLRGIYPRLTSRKLKEAIFQGMGDTDRSDGSAWLIARAGDSGESIDLRKSALFWAGQRKATPTKDLVALYRSSTSSELREHALFVLSQRDDESAFSELMRIARDDSDKRMRARALFWLGQKDDPRVAKLIGDRVLR